MAPGKFFAMTEEVIKIPFLYEDRCCLIQDDRGNICRTMWIVPYVFRSFLESNRLYPDRSSMTDY